MLKYKVYLISFIVILFSIQVLAETRINEIIYNPKGTDNYKEFVEIYSDEPTDIGNYTISDGDSEDKLVKINNVSSNYALIVETGYILNIPENVALYSAGAAIGNGLSDSDKIILYDSEKNEVSSLQLFKITEGYSIEYFDGNYYKSLDINGTPGYENSIKEIPKETEIADTENTTEETETPDLNQDSNIEINNIPDNIKFGNNISIEVSVYRGSTAKYAVYFFIGKDNNTKITDKLSEHALKKYTNYTFIYSLKLKDNCNDRYEEGKYYIFISGLEKELSQEIEILNNHELCGTEDINNEDDEEIIIENDTKQEINNIKENINDEAQITGNIVYESSDKKAERLALYLFCFLLILVVIYLLIKKKDGN
ncbi:MAG: lamin tail domain-containing protein [Nanoarchaeota archaeon]|nr:lamin tail domain-containing protein [Nanoarchaeota archaeon]